MPQRHKCETLQQRQMKTSFTMKNVEEQELLNFTKLWDEAMVNNNANEIAKFMSDDW